MKNKRFQKRGVKRWLLLFGLLVLIGATYLLGWSNVFSVKHIVVEGAPSLVESRLVANSVRIGNKMARLETKNLTKTLNNFPWLERSIISRNWFSGEVTIHIWTRRAVAKIDGNLIDRFGRIFQLTGNNDSGLPTIDASTPVEQLLAVKVLDQLSPQLRNSLRTISATGAHSVQLLVEEKSVSGPRMISIIWGDLSQSDLKSRVYSALIALPENEKISLVDVSAPHAPIVK